MSQYYIKTNITAIERTKKDPIVRFDAQTNLPGFRTTQFRDIRRTYHEFEKLANHLINQNPECIVPTLYPSTTSYGVGTDEDERKLKSNMQHWLDLISENTVLMRDEEMVHFIESDFGWSPVHSSGKPATGIKRRAIKQLQPPPDDCVELVEARPIVKQFYVWSDETSSKLGKVVRSRANLALAEQDFGKHLSTLAQGETHSGIANALNKLGRTLQAVGDTHSAHATHEAATLGDAFQYLSKDAFNAKETLTTRQILIRELNQAQNASRTRQATASRMRSSSTIQSAKADEAIVLVEEAKATEQQLSAKLNRVTGNLLIETRAWKARTSADLKFAMQEFVKKQVESERRILAILESVRPDIRAIDASGGLSRLGRGRVEREGSNIGPSQTSDGDSWSGVKRTNKTVPTGLDPTNRSRSSSTAALVPDSVKAEALNDRVNARNAASILANGFYNDDSAPQITDCRCTAQVMTSTCALQLEQCTGSKIMYSGIIQVLLFLNSVSAWSFTGHELIAHVASDLLSPRAAHAIHDILGGAHLSTIAAWADTITWQPHYRYSSRLHYINTPSDDPPNKCVFEWRAPGEQEVIAAVYNYTQRLRSAQDGTWAQSEALRFVVHFVQDMHQPLHLSGRARGGNDVFVHFDGYKTNLHKVWDGLSLMKRMRQVFYGKHGNDTSFQADASNAISQANAKAPTHQADANEIINQADANEIINQADDNEMISQADRNRDGIMHGQEESLHELMTSYHTYILDLLQTRHYVEKQQTWLMCPHDSGNPKYGCADYWAKDVAILNCEYVWRDVVEDGTLSKEYWRRIEDDAVIEESVMKAAVRLAAVLNSVFENRDHKEHDGL